MMEPTKLTLTVLSGLPGAGKSTKARALAATSQAVVVSRDADIRRNMPYLSEGEITLHLVKLAASFLRNQLSVIVDSPNLDPRDRVRWAELARVSGADLIWLHLGTPVEECVRRDAKRTYPVGAEVIREMARQMGV